MWVSIKIPLLCVGKVSVSSEFLILPMSQKESQIAVKDDTIQIWMILKILSQIGSLAGISIDFSYPWVSTLVLVHIFSNPQVSIWVSIKFQSLYVIEISVSSVFLKLPNSQKMSQMDNTTQKWTILSIPWSPEVFNSPRQILTYKIKFLAINSRVKLI